MSASRLPYRMDELMNQLGQTPSRKEQSYTSEVSCNIISDQFLLAGQYGYDYYFTRTLDIRDYHKKDLNQIRRKVKLRFKCKNSLCPYLLRAKTVKKWTSLNGLSSAYFVFTDLKHSDKLDNIQDRFPYKLLYHFYIYRQRCKACDKWGEPSIYDSQINILSKMYSLIISTHLQNDGDPKKMMFTPIQTYGEKIPYFLGHPHKPHDSKLCQACQLGRCNKRRVS